VGTATLWVARGNDQGKIFELSQDVTTIGRDAGNRVQIHDSEVSRRHAEIRRQGNDYVLVDLESANGCLVNQKKTAKRALQNGDHLQLGRTLLLFTHNVASTGRLPLPKVDIVAADRSSAVISEQSDGSRILHSVTRDEGSRIVSAREVEASRNPFLARLRGDLQIMYLTAMAVSHTLDVDQLLDKILGLIFEWVECDRGCILLLEPDGEGIRPRAVRTRQGEGRHEKFEISRTILDYVLEKKEGVLTSDAQEDSRWEAGASILQQAVHEAICVPMQGRYGIVGAIYIDTFVSPGKILQRPSSKFSEDHLKLTVAIGHQAALAVEDSSFYSAMVQSERLAAIGQTVAVLSHHVKNILQGISGGSYLIQEGLKKQSFEEIRKGWEFVERNQDRISGLVLDMLSYSKEREPERTPGDLNQAVADVVELMQSRANDFNVVLTFEAASNLGKHLFDAEAVHRAILNLVTNAIDACRESDGGRVDTTVEKVEDPPRLRVIVKDDGEGIAPEDIKRIFSIFESNKGSRGTGLGLPVSQKIAQEHGGRIVVQSDVGAGSSFIFEIPAIVESPAAVGETLTGRAN
jgi:signal transduction histidine kinase